MAINLTKGQKIDLTKTNPGIALVRAGLGWAKRTTDGAEFDLDAGVILLNAEGKARNENDFIYYNNPVSPCSSIKANGDNRNGEGDGDDESVSLKLSDIPQDVARIQFTVSIHEAEERRQNFGMVKDAYITICNESTGEVLTRFDLSEDFSTETGVVMAELYRHNGEWKFNAVGQGYREGLIAILKDAGLA
jgi:tellurium resistance protein TerD